MRLGDLGKIWVSGFGPSEPSRPAAQAAKQHLTLAQGRTRHPQPLQPPSRSRAPEQKVARSDTGGRGPAPIKNGPDPIKKRSGPFGPATLARVAGPLWGGGPARFRGGPAAWPARLAGRAGPIGGVARPDLAGGPARLGGGSGPIWGVVRTGGRRAGHPPDRAQPTSYGTPVPI